MRKYHIAPMPAPLAPALRDRLGEVEIATIGHFRHRGFVHRSIQALTPPARCVIGVAVTLAIPGPDSTLLHHALGLLRPGDILVIDRLGDDRHACLGGGVVSRISCDVELTGANAVDAVTVGVVTERVDHVDRPVRDAARAGVGQGTTVGATVDLAARVLRTGVQLGRAAVGLVTDVVVAELHELAASAARHQRDEGSDLHSNSQSSTAAKVISRSLRG